MPPILEMKINQRRLRKRLRYQGSAITTDPRKRNQLKLHREGTALPEGAYAANPRNENQSKARKEDTALPVDAYATDPRNRNQLKLLRKGTPQPEARLYHRS